MRVALIILVIFNVALQVAMHMRNTGRRGDHQPTGFNSNLISIVPLRDEIRVTARCVELGPFSPQEAIAARQMLAERSLSELVSSVEASFTDGWWVYIPSRANRSEALARARELGKLGVRDMHVFDEGPYKFAISLGMFRSEVAAAEYLADLARRGVKGARSARQEQRVTSTLFHVRSQAPEVIARITEVKAQFARAELRQVACPASAAGALPARVGG